ncbi:MAG: hypothetical protein A3A97_01435 [Candidatus Terrybacteria bacterium RIFCSPLOWO2_01_FULL_40_23]|uniref:Peptidase M50 domain-containing protein n=1 Tax=Candidatus Terrybacteria bacterium RIFCSPLOWO2_01_FULL_40_23 TaxID=1802366 RepID=A0A1G2PX44_9BACT|nr:MAG: hypothetical protein A3A97_01435 [Candidatus Terrybacteria bacterium RIFCSPLOWO2_01_FULL_40_23]
MKKWFVLFFVIIFIVLFPYQSLFLIFFFLALAGHEVAGHAGFMRRYKIKIAEISLGISRQTLRLRKPGNPFKIIRPAGSMHVMGKTFDIPLLTIQPIPIGANTEPTQNGKRAMASLPLYQKLQIYGAGIYINILLAILCYLALWMIPLFYALTNHVTPDQEVVGNILKSLALLIIFVVFRYFLSMAAPIVLGVVTFLLLVPTLAVPEGKEMITGPVGMITIGMQATSLINVLVIGFALNIGLAMGNSLPLAITDGGVMLKMILKRIGVKAKWRRALNKICFVMLLILVFFPLAMDIKRLLPV